MNRAEQVYRGKRLWKIACTELFEFLFELRIAQSRDHNDSGPPLMAVAESPYPIQKIKAVVPRHDEVEQYGVGPHLLYGSHSPIRFLAKGYRGTEVG